MVEARKPPSTDNQRASPSGSLALVPLLLLCAQLLTACDPPHAQTTADWDRHDAYQFCNAAIADYPASPAPPCEAMHMCANEGALSDAETKKLYDMMSKTPSCPAP